MSKETSLACQECGARLPEGAAVCDLCGAPVAPADPSIPLRPERRTSEDKGRVSGVYCHQCGWKNPPTARFCSMCGTPLQEVPGAREPGRTVSPSKPAPTEKREQVSEPSGTEPGADSQQAITRQVGIIVGAALLLVVALFLISTVSNERQSAPGASAAATPATPVPPDAVATQEDAPPLPPQIEARVAELRAQIDAAGAEAKPALQAQLVNLLEGTGRLDLAAIEQQKLAEQVDTPEEWRHAGNLYYDWMTTLEGPRKVEIAEQAIAAYQQVLAADPNNLDARTDMAVAYLSSNNPMLGVEEVTKVLEADSTHVPALFNYGVMLAMIGRTEKAEEQFEAVKRIVGDPTSPYYERAEMALQSMRGQPMAPPSDQP